MTSVPPDGPSRAQDLLPVIPRDGVLGEKKKPKDKATTGATAATMRALTARMVAFYFRAPIKAFFRARVDYMGYTRAINPYIIENPGKWSWRATTPGLLVHAVRTYGWSFLPNQILPPLLANAAVGSVLYVSYLQILGAYHEPSSRSTKRVYPPPSYSHTFGAGFVAGGIQSLIAAPLDALHVRFNANDMLEGKYKNMWHYAGQKMHSIGLRGIFAGYSISFVKDSFGAALFFSTFETIKSQAFYEFVTRWYGHAERQPGLLAALAKDGNNRPVIRPHYLVEPAFILGAGIMASVSQMIVLHPLQEIQTVHYSRLESLDLQAKSTNSHRKLLRLYYHAYQKTLEQCAVASKQHGGWAKYLYNGFVWNTIRAVPSTAAGLIAFEVVRRRYAIDEEAVRIEKDGYDILLT